MDADLLQKVKYLLKYVPAEEHGRMADELGIERKHIKNLLTGSGCNPFSDSDMERIIEWILEESGMLEYYLT